jgi:hypothetical protein
MTTSVVRPSARALVSDDLFRRLTDRIIEDEGYGSHLAERIMEQALAFLDACAINKGTPLSPSKPVDVGWHTFLMYTKDYAEFCHRIAGRFIHHVPDDAPGRSSAADVRSRTMAAVTRPPADVPGWAIAVVALFVVQVGVVKPWLSRRSDVVLAGPGNGEGRRSRAHLACIAVEVSRSPAW